ncbi:hypothetical protein THTE_2509 [Thermogutta terrifontis]|jgi:hypothetical protein|uniref:DUF2760 domain-containing protein n=1 Tax=Thermogutta terrifontis TaxID=1331910 RepID=A0A286RGM9_9BACT|nr:DUF2760 domain-containing protein [Thermogutta terrifontis]ASV75111.1 hypothetical protein THTE_2509 [Thermogutta terrifontis]
MVIWDAIRIFFATLFDRETARRVREVLEKRRIGERPSEAQPAEAVLPKPAVQPLKPAPGKAAKSEALILLETLQREARFVDFIKEDLSGYSDAQIGAAVRDIHRDCAAVLERLFAIRPAIDVPEGAEYVIPESFDSGRIRLVGNVHGGPPYRGRVTHHGWEATECRLPVWTGTEASARIIAPAEVEVGGP